MMGWIYTGISWILLKWHAFWHFVGVGDWLVGGRRLADCVTSLTTHNSPLITPSCDTLGMEALAVCRALERAICLSTTRLPHR